MTRDRRPSKQMVKLLSAFVAGSSAWRHGYDLMKDTGLASGTLYPLLMRMAERDLVEAAWHEAVGPGRPPRHAYRLTASGCALAASVASTDNHAAGASLA